MMNYEQALALCQNETESAAGLICDLFIRVDTQQRQIESLLKTGADLARVVAKLSKNSSNSSKPPSSEAGRETNERLWTVVGTCALQGRSAYEFILAAVHASFFGKPEPSLLSVLG